jgi:hypothetical protein
MVNISAAFSEPPVKVLVFPFAIHAPDDQAFLKQAVMDMLYTRLSGEGRTIAFYSDPASDTAQTGSAYTTEKQALAIGLDQNADYILMGSLTLLGQTVSTDARLIRLADQKSLMTFNRSGQGHGSVIEHVDALTAQINNDIIRSEKSDAAPVISDSKKAKPAAEDSIIPSESPARDVNLSYWKSENFKTEIHSLAIGDVNGDGKNETVFVDGSHIHIYQYSAKTFALIQTISEKSHNRFIRVDAADINQNGIAEIFITNYIPIQKRPQSFVLEWNGTAYEKISEKTEWYYRVTHHASKGAILLGQKVASDKNMDSGKDIKDALFEKGVYQLQWQDNAYQPSVLQNLPGDLTIYGYVSGDVANKNQDKIVALSNSGYLTVMDLKGEKEWESDKPYGGSTIFFEITDPYNSERQEYYYLPQRIYLTDFDKDSTNEIIVVKNQDAARALSHSKFFKEGSIECLAYDDIGMQLKWQTRKISGYICDYVIGDFDNDGQDDLVFASVAKKKSAINKGRSAIIACSIVRE